MVATTRPQSRMILIARPPLMSRPLMSRPFKSRPFKSRPIRRPYPMILDLLLSGDSMSKIMNQRCDLLR
jgi:hypothetical protein